MKRKIVILCSICICFVFMNLLTTKAAITPEKGIDVSQNNGTIDWNKVKKAGYMYVMIKSGDGRAINGNTDENPRFYEYYQGAKKAGLKVGVYHVCCCKTVAQAKEEARNCLNILKKYGIKKLDYPIAYDIEREGTFLTGKKNVSSMAAAFCESVKKQGFTPMLYVSTYYLNTYFDLEMIKDYRLWIANYGSLRPKVNRSYDMIQYSNKGNVDGANNHLGVCDVNYSYFNNKVKAKKSSVTIGAGEKLSIKDYITTSGYTGMLSYAGNNQKIASVSKTGVVKGKKTGKVKITVSTMNNRKTTITVFVKKKPTSLKLKKTSVTLKKGKKYQIKYTLNKGSYSKKMTYTSSKKSVAVVDQNGMVKAKKKGTAVITVSTYNKITKKLKVKVTK